MAGETSWLVWIKEYCSPSCVIGAKGFAAKVWMFESMDVSGMDPLSRAKDVKFVGGEWKRAEQGR